MNYSRVLLQLSGFVSVLALAHPTLAPAQTVLSAGDIAFTMYNASATTPGAGADSAKFSFVTFRDLSPNTTISFTDIGWNGSAFRAAIGASVNETSLTYTTTSAVARGTQITIGYANSGAGPLATSATGGTVAYSSGSQASILWSSAGDQILAYQGTFGASASFLTGINTSTGNFSTVTGWNTSATTLSDSLLPSALTTGTSAIALSVTGSPGSYSANALETINAQLNFSTIQPSTFRTQAQWQAIVNNPLNWSQNTTANASFTPSVITLAVIPEPPTWILGGAILGFVAIRQRRRRPAAWS